MLAQRRTDHMLFEADLEKRRERKAERWQPSTRGSKYSDYMRSEFWQVRRAAVIERDGGRCRSCATPDAKHVHHITYKRFGAEPLSDLVLLCSQCHEYEHATHTLRARERYWREQNERIPALDPLPSPGNNRRDSGTDPTLAHQRHQADDSAGKRSSGSNGGSRIRCGVVVST